MKKKSTVRLPISILLISLYLLLILLLQGCKTTSENPTLVTSATENSTLETFSSDLALEAKNIEYPYYFEITFPSPAQSTIAPGRDFYVIGNIKATGAEPAPLPDDTHFSVSLVRDADGSVVREVYADIKDNHEGMYVDYERLNIYSGDMSISMMPDLVYDPADVSTFRNVWRKCCYSDNNFTAVLSGGEYDLDINLAAEDGTPLTRLDNGTYTIIVQAGHNDEVLAYTEYAITIGVNEEKILSRFSPSTHFAKISEQAQINNFVIYTDPFPGGWFPADYGIAGLEDGSVSGEILERAIHSDSVEYREGRAHFYIYNVSETSATYSVEISTIQITQAIDNPSRLQIYYYDTGEPFLGDLAGSFLQLDPGDRLQFTRADYQTDPDSTSNYVDTSSFGSLESDFDVYDGINVEPGEAISLYGIVPPIQNTFSQIHQNDVGNFTLDNRIMQIEYTFTFKDGTSHSQEEPVNLIRVTDGRELPSILEFKHDISIEAQWAGQTITVQAQGYDAFGNVVTGAYEEFTLYVEDEAAESIPDAA